MFVDKMHTAAIRAADESGLPMTVYRIGRDWYHTNSVAAADVIRGHRAIGSKVVAVVTWLPKRYFVV